MQHESENLTIGTLAKKVGVHVETIRYYHSRGLLPVPDRPYGSIRHYGHSDILRLQFIKSAKNLGFSLDEVSELLQLDDGMHCHETSDLAKLKLQSIQEKIAELSRMETVLIKLIKACYTSNAKTSCPLILALHQN